MPSVEAINDALRGVIDPELGDDVNSLGMIRSVGIDGGEVTIELIYTVDGCPLRVEIRDDVIAHVQAVPGVTHVRVRTGSMNAEERSQLMTRARWKARERAVGLDIPTSARILAIASGKGGVGKSSVTVNLAAALANRGFTVGVLDADIWGFSVPRMLGMEGDIPVAVGKMQPIERLVGKGKLKVLSMGFLSGENEAVMWRGLLLNRAVQHFLEDVRWGELDYLLVDMPPGTGDVQMGLARMVPRAEMLIVTTPALAAQKVAARAADMARRGFLRVGGVIENMTSFICEHGESYPLFGEGGGTRLANEIGAPLLAQIPLDATVAAGGDTGNPVALTGNSPAGKAFSELAALIAETMAPITLTGCTARMLDNIETVLGTTGTDAP